MYTLGALKERAHFAKILNTFPGGCSSLWCLSCTPSLLCSPVSQQDVRVGFVWPSSFGNLIGTDRMWALPLECSQLSQGQLAGARSQACLACKWWYSMWMAGYEILKHKHKKRWAKLHGMALKMIFLGCSVCMLLCCNLEPHGTVFRKPTGLAHLWVEADAQTEHRKFPGIGETSQSETSSPKLSLSSQAWLPGRQVAFLKSGLCRLLPFAETAFLNLAFGMGVGGGRASF